MAPARRRSQAASVRRPVQLGLEFSAPDAAPAVPANIPPAEDSSPKPANPQVQSGQNASKNIAKSPDSGTVAFRHPRATRELVLAGRLVAYEVRRRKRRTLGFSVGSEGLVVSAPPWVALYEIDRAVHGKSGWILKKLHETRERQRRLDALRIEWKDGAVFPFLGDPVCLALDPGLAQSSALDTKAESAGISRFLRLRLPAGATALQVEQAVQAWLMQQAMALFTARLDFFAPQLGVQWGKLGLSSAATRWGSASSSGAIRLNWRLMHLRPVLIDYVVVHELSHLRFMDHSARFWATVESILPNHAILRRELKGTVIPKK